MLVFRELLRTPEAPLAASGEGGRASSAAGGTAVLKLSMPTPFGWYFFNIRYGRERRSVGRLRAENQLAAAKLSVAYTLLIWAAAGFIGLGIMVAVYLLKSFAGIDLMEGASFLHDFAF